MLDDTKFAAMKAQAAFENGKGDPNKNLQEWFCAEIIHANQYGLDWMTMASQMGGIEPGDQLFKALAGKLAQWRAGRVVKVPQVA